MIEKGKGSGGKPKNHGRMAAPVGARFIAPGCIDNMHCVRAILCSYAQILCNYAQILCNYAQILCNYAQILCNYVLSRANL